MGSSHACKLSFANTSTRRLEDFGPTFKFFFSVSDALRYPFKKGSLRALLTEVGHVLIIVVSEKNVICSAVFEIK